MNDPSKYIGKQFFEVLEDIDVRLPFRGEKTYKRLLPKTKIYFMTREDMIDYWSTSPDHATDHIQWFILTDDQKKHSLSHLIKGDN